MHWHVHRWVFKWHRQYDQHMDGRHRAVQHKAAARRMAPHAGDALVHVDYDDAGQPDDSDMTAAWQQSKQPEVERRGQP